MKLMRLIFSLLILASCARAQIGVQVPILYQHLLSSTANPVQGYFMWYSITNAVTNNAGVSPPANGDTVKAWGDLSSSNYVLQMLASTKQPMYRTTTLNQSPPPDGGPFITFGTPTSDNGLTNNWPTTYSQPNTFFYVLDGNGRNGVPLFNAASDQNQQVIWQVPPGGPWMTAGSTMQTPNAFQASDTWMVFTFQFNGSSSVFRSNGVVVAFSSGTTVGAGGLKGITVGDYFGVSGGGTGWGGGICEIVGYNSALSSGSMLTEEEYLAHKHGITGVP